MSEVVAFEPREHPSVELNRDTLIVTTNHLGADMRGDAGLDAQYIADISGHRVVGLNRIGSGDDVDYSKSLAKRITDDPDGVTAEWCAHISPELRRQSPSRIELVGRSAGANLMLHVAALELIPETTGVFAVEALRLQAVSTRLGQLKYLYYQSRKEGRFKDRIDEVVDKDLRPSADERPPKAADAKLMLSRQIVDIRHYQHLWASDLPLRNALEIAERDNITASLVFAEESMSANPRKLHGLIEKIQQRRKTNANHPLAARVAPFTTHGSFDDQRLYATHYRRFADLAS